MTLPNLIKLNNLQGFILLMVPRRQHLISMYIIPDQDHLCNCEIEITI
jgi:hypothetical protein